MSEDHRRAGWERDPYPHPVDTKVTGDDVGGRRFAGVVTEVTAAFTVRVDGTVTPVSLISTAPTVDDAFEYDLSDDSI